MNGVNLMSDNPIVDAATEIRNGIHDIDRQFDAMAHTSNSLLRVVTAIIDMCLRSHDDQLTVAQFKQKILNYMKHELPTAIEWKK
jgi:hypothetical protein